MKGFKIEIGNDKNKAYSFIFFEKIEDLIKYLSNSIEFEFSNSNLRDWDIHIKQMELQKCYCGRLYEDECLFCENIRFDAMIEARAERQEIEKLRGDDYGKWADRV